MSLFPVYDSKEFSLLGCNLTETATSIDGFKNNICKGQIEGSISIHFLIFIGIRGNCDMT